MKPLLMTADIVTSRQEGLDVFFLVIEKKRNRDAVKPGGKKPLRVFRRTFTEHYC